MEEKSPAHTLNIFCQQDFQFSLINTGAKLFDIGFRGTYGSQQSPIHPGFCLPNVIVSAIGEASPCSPPKLCPI